MWECNNCGEEHEDHFDFCWNCGSGKDGKLAKDQAGFRAMKDEVAESKHSGENISSYRTTRRVAKEKGKKSYAYRVVQIPANIQISRKHFQGGEAASYMESVINEHAAQGWEFYRVDQIGVQVNPGCLGALLGREASELKYYVITFRSLE